MITCMSDLAFLIMAFGDWLPNSTTYCNELPHANYEPLVLTSHWAYRRQCLNE